MGYNFDYDFEYETTTGKIVWGSFIAGDNESFLAHTQRISNFSVNCLMKDRNTYFSSIYIKKFLNNKLRKEPYMHPDEVGFEI